MARSRRLHASLTRDTFAGAVKLRCEDLNITLAELALRVGLKPDTLRARLCNGYRGKRSLQPRQVSAIAKALGMDEAQLHRLAAKHEGWIIEAAA